MEDISLITRDFFNGNELNSKSVNCRVEYYTDNLNNPSNICVKATGGISPPWCCKYIPQTPSGTPASKEISKCWTTCSQWENRARDANV